jgi:hypothetical protein
MLRAFRIEVMELDQLKRRSFITLLGGVAARGTRAADGNAGDWIYQRGFARVMRACC